MNEPKDIVKAPETAVVVSSHDTIIEHAITSGATMEQLEKFMILKERHEAFEANKAYCREMAVVQQKIPVIAKTLENKQTSSKYADLSNIIKFAKEVYTARGFSISFYESDSPKEEHIRINADVRHADGHKETCFFDMPLDGKGIRGNSNMTPIHAKKSSVSYGRNILMCMIWNIPTGDDDDGNKAGASAEYIDDKQLSTIRDFVDNKGIPESNLLKYAGVETLEEIPKSDFDKVISSINVTLSKRGKSGEVVDVNNE